MSGSSDLLSKSSSELCKTYAVNPEEHRVRVRIDIITELDRRDERRKALATALRTVILSNATFCDCGGDLNKNYGPRCHSKCENAAHCALIVGCKE